MNFIKKILLSIVVGLCFCSVTYAEDASDNLTKLLQNMHSMQSSFVQNIQDKNGRAVQTSSGRMSIQRPGQFRWEVIKPNKQTIIANGKKLWIYDPDLEQVTIRALSKAAGETPAMLLSDENLSLGKEFSVRAMNKRGSGLEWYHLVPTDPNSMVASLQLGFADHALREMHLQDHLGHNTVITFSNSKLNSEMATSLFTFKPPAHIDVIDETKRS